MPGANSTSELDLSFLDAPKKESAEPPKSAKETGLNLSFLEPKAPIKTEEPKQPKTVGNALSDMFTGNDRKARAYEDLPELQNSGILKGENSAKAAAISPVLLTATNPDEIGQILTENFPNIVVTHDKDESGNVFPIYTNRETGAKTILNKPGMSAMDVLQGLGLGAAFFPAGKAGAGATTVLSKMGSVAGRSGATQGAIEGAQVASGGEFNASDVGFAAAAGGVFEGVAQGLGAAWPVIKRQINGGQITDDIRNAFKSEAQKLGLAPDEVTDDVIKAWTASADNRTGLEREFDVTLTRGERSGDQIALAAEDSFRSGIKGEKAQREYLTREGIQSNQLKSAAAKTQDEIAKGAPLISSREEAGSALADGVRQAEKVADDAITEAYAQVGDASLSPDGYEQLLRATRRATNSIEFPKVGNVQAWEGLQKEILKAEKSLQAIKTLPSARLKPVHINQIESIRKAIGNAASASGSPADKRNILAMKDAFDDKMDDLVIKGMFSGDPQALEALKSARGVFRDYMKKFGQNTKSSRLGTGRDAEGQFIKKIILENPTDGQVIDSLWAASGFNKKAAANMASRYKEILGPDSTEWNMVRQAAFDQIVGKRSVNGEIAVDGARTYSNLMKAQQQNMQLMKELFTGEELMKLRRFAALAKRTAPDLQKSRANPSGTGATLIKNAGSLLKFLPFVDLGLSAGAEGAIIFKNSANANAAKEAFRPFAKRTESAAGQAIEGAVIGSSPAAASALLEKF